MTGKLETVEEKVEKPKDSPAVQSKTSYPTVAIHPNRGLFDLDLKAIWERRELLYVLIWKDVIGRYKQTLIGAGWAILQPLITMVMFSVVFGKFAKVPSEGIPYPIFAYTALLPWTYFSHAIGRIGGSLVGSGGMISKVYFPRLIIPLAAVTIPIVDFLFSFVILLGMMVWYKVTPTWGMLTLPLLMLMAAMTALSVGLWLSALNVRYRDVGYMIPFLIQVWMYASPVAYPVSLVPEKWRVFYCMNPMAGVIEGFRWALLGKVNPHFALMGVSLVIVVVLLIGGAIFFRRVERTFADVI